MEVIAVAKLIGKYQCIPAIPQCYLGLGASFPDTSLPSHEYNHDFNAEITYLVTTDSSYSGFCI